ncbi:MAG: ATP-binding protein [Actinomycetota bacterium]|nr:ATP-binding protein [Actinomycetota bacterium]
MRLLRRMFGGLRGKILLVILIISGLTGICVGTASYLMARSSIRKQVTSNLVNTMRSAEEILDDVWLPIITQRMEFIAYAAQELYEGRDDFQNTGEQLEDALESMPGFKRLSVFMNNGFLLASSDPDYNPGKQDELVDMGVDERVIVPFRRLGGDLDYEVLMTIAVPLVLDGAVVASVAGDVESQPLSEELASKRVGELGEIYLVNAEGQLITLPPRAGESSQLSILGQFLDTEGVKRVIDGETGTAEYTNYAGEKVLGSFTWIPRAQWGLIVEENADQAFSDLGTLRTSVILIILGFLVVACLAAVLFSRRISEPVVVLQKGVEKLGLGEMSYRVDLRTGDEFESLARSFNRMAGAIESSHEGMLRSVRERTGQLRILNEMITSLRGTLSPDQIMQKALHSFMSFSDYDRGWCYLAGDEGWRLLYGRGLGDKGDGVPEVILPGEGLLGEIMERREPWFEAIVQSESGFDPDFPVESLVALPLQSPTRVLGLICLAADGRRGLSEGARGTMRAMADEVGIALENAMLYMELSDHIEEVERANRELRTLDEMKSNFISAVTHELKQPLALISGYAQTVCDYYDSLTFEEEMHCMRVILERTQFLTGLVEDLLDLSMLEMGRTRLHLEELDLAGLAARKAREFALATGQEVIVDLPSPFPRVSADARRIEQVLDNLLSNAVKFSHGRGVIHVRGRLKDAGVEVRVEDQGVGIESSQLDRIFDRFYQADASTRRLYPGVGLGLFICRQLIEAHGGRIWAENRPEGGSAFIFELPGDSEAGGEIADDR